jgi:hypothetical protein
MSGNRTVTAPALRSRTSEGKLSVDPGRTRPSSGQGPAVRCPPIGPARALSYEAELILLVFVLLLTLPGRLVAARPRRHPG